MSVRVSGSVALRQTLAPIRTNDVKQDNLLNSGCLRRKLPPYYD
jgi:hypothetical protein